MTLLDLDKQKTKEVKQKIKELIKIKEDRLKVLDKKYSESWEEHPHQTKLQEHIEELKHWVKRDLQYFK